MRHQYLLGAAVVALAIPAAASAQETTSTIRGTVTSGGAPVAGATVVAINVPSNTRAETSTDAQGNFTLPGLRVGGPFTVEITSASGNKTVTEVYTVAQQPFELPVDLAATPPTDAAADAGATGNEVVVTAASIRGAGTAASGPRTVLTQEDIRKVASVNRDIRDLERRDPLASLDLTNSRAVSFAGVNPRFNRFTINGVQIGDNFGLQSDANPTGRGPVPFDAISQFSVSIAPSDIRQGNFQGGAIDTVLLSGTNEFHGTGFYSQNTDGLTGERIGSSRPAVGRFKSETYGATFSGPLIADKLFFMVSAERNTDPRPLLGATIDQIPRLTAANLASVQSIAQNVYGYNTGGLVGINNQKDEKIVGRVDWNVTDGQRLSLSYVNALESSTIGGSTGVAGGTVNPITSYALGLESNVYQRTVLVRAGIAQLNSTWTDQFSTEARFLYKSNKISQIPLRGNNFAQFTVCTDPTSITVGTTANNQNNTTSCGNNARVIFGPDASRQANELFFDTWGGSLQARYNAGTHDIKVLAEYNRNRTTNLFLQNASGVYYFDSLQDFQNRNASSFSYQNAISLNVADSASDFIYDQWTFGIQDRWQVTDTFDLTYGVRYDLYGMRSPVAANGAFFARNGFYNTENYKGLDNYQPRLSFNWKPIPDLRIRGTAAVFGGGSPDIYLSNSYSNTGVLTNAINSLGRVTATPGGGTLTCGAPFTGANAGVCTAALNGVTGTSIPAAVNNYIQTSISGQRTAPVSALQQNFKTPSVTKLNLSADYKLFGFNIGADYLFTTTNRGVAFTDLRSRVAGVLPDGRPRYTFAVTPGAGAQTADNNGDYLIYNDGRGRSHVAIVRFDKQFDWGLSFGGSYAYQDVKDVSPATSSTPGSLYATAAKADPNFPTYGVSSDETKWAFKYNLGFDHAFFGDYKTTLQLFGETRAGRHYSFTMLDTPPTGLTNAQCTRTCTFGTIGNNNAFLLYVPTGATGDARVSYDTQDTANALNTLIENTSLKKYRGQISPKNIARSRALTRIDLHAEQELPTFIGKSRISIFADVENLPNLLNSKWGGLRQLAFPYTASPIRVQCLQTPVATGTTPTAAQFSATAATPCAQYRYTSYQEPNENNLTSPVTNSLYLIRVGARFSF